MLNESQKGALNRLARWWESPEQFIILNAPGGYGKTFLVKHFLAHLANLKSECEPVLLAPTHEALAQLREAMSSQVPSMTVHASLGIRPTIKENSIEFKEGIPHSIWGDVNLAIIDESSMLSKPMLDRLMTLGKKILFIGHDAQLPPINETKSILRLSESPVFTTNDNLARLTLTIPMRNRGELHDYLCRLEALVKCPNQGINLSSKFEVTATEVERYIKSQEGKDAFIRGQANVIAWTNTKVTQVNAKIRKELFGTDAKHKYVKGDRIILTKPVNIPDNGYSKSIPRLLKSINRGISLHTNTPGTVESMTPVSYDIDGIVVHGTTLLISTTLGTFPVVELQEECLVKLAKHLERRAWGNKSVKECQKAYRERYDVLSSFASIQHSYAITAHRAQGRTIPTVIVMLSDILKNPNRSEALRCWYTAASRASNQLMIVRGII